MSGDLEKSFKFRFRRFIERKNVKEILYTIAIVLLALVLGLLNSCQTVKPSVDTSKTDSLGIEVQQTQTEVATGTHDLSGTIGILKETTDQIKDGVATKEQTAVIVKYVNKGAEQVTYLTGKVDYLTELTAKYQQSRIQDNVAQGNTIAAQNAEIEKLKPWKGRFWKVVGVIVLLAAGIAGYVFLRIKGRVK